MKDQYQKLLKKHGVTATKQRLQLSNIIFAKHQHFSASDLIDKIQKNKLPISQATIYNTLSLFESKGLLKTIHLENEKKFYDTNLNHHYHIYNTSTNTLSDIDHNRIEFSKLPEIPKNLQLEQAEVLLRVKNK